MHMYVCIYSHKCLWYVCLPVPRVSLKSDTECWQPWLSLGKMVGMTFHRLSFVFWNFVPCTCTIYSKINSFWSLIWFHFLKNRGRRLHLHLSAICFLPSLLPLFLGKGLDTWCWDRVSCIPDGAQTPYVKGEPELLILWPPHPVLGLQVYFSTPSVCPGLLAW